MSGPSRQSIDPVDRPSQSWWLYLKISDDIDVSLIKFYKYIKQSDQNAALIHSKTIFNKIHSTHFIYESMLEVMLEMMLRKITFSLIITDSTLPRILCNDTIDLSSNVAMNPLALYVGLSWYPDNIGTICNKYHWWQTMSSKIVLNFFSTAFNMSDKKPFFREIGNVGK